MEHLVQRVKRHERDGGRAIGVGDDARVQFHVGRVDFWDDQRHRVVHTERTGVVDHHATRLRRDGRELFRDAAASTEQRDVDPLE